MIGVSVIIPVYNVEKYLEECLNSVINQDFTSYEIICINDGATDNSLEILEKYAEEYKEIRIINCSKNQGLSSARNIGLNSAMGKYILFLDSDDMIILGTLQELFTYAENYDLDEVFFNADRLYGKELQQENSPQELSEHLGIFSGQELFYLFMEDGAPRYSACRQLYKREFLIKCNLYFYEGILHEDVLFYFLTTINAKRVINVNKSYYIYRQRAEDSIMSVINRKRIEGLYTAMYEIFKYWDRNDFPMHINRAIGKYFESIYSTFLYYLKCYKQSKELENESYAKKFIVDLVSGSSNTIATLSKDKIETLKLEKNIIVYGAGRVANDIIDLLEKNNIRICAITVTDTQASPITVRGIKVLPIQCLCTYKNSSVVIIGVSKRNVQAIKEKLNTIGFLKILEVDYC